MKYIEHRLPTVFILENRKNLVSTTHQEFFSKLIAWMRRLKLVDGSLAYDVQWHVFNSMHFGVPQNRERVYIIGRRTNTLLKSYNHKAFICNVMSHATSCVPSIRKFLKITGETPTTTDIRSMATSNIMRKNLAAARTA
jgi:site-specific DNA-cytosine methylase